MKKAGIIILIVLLIGILVFLSEILRYSIKNKGEWGNMFSAVEKIEGNIKTNETLKVEDIKKIKMEFIASSVKIILTDEPEMRVIEYNDNDNKNTKLEINTSSEEITIKEVQKRFFFFFDFGNHSAYEIYLPKQYKNVLELSNVSGDIAIEGNIDVSDLKIKTTSAKLELPIQLKADKMELSSISGSIKVNKIESKEAKISTTSGSIKITEIEAEQIEMKSVSGSIRTEKLEGKAELESTSGGIEIESLKVTGNSSMKSVSGSIKINVTQDSNCLIKTKTVSGSTTLPNDKNTVGNEPYHNLDLKTTSGSIRVNTR